MITYYTTIEENWKVNFFFFFLIFRYFQVLFISLKISTSCFLGFYFHLKIGESLANWKMNFALCADSKATDNFNAIIQYKCHC